MRFRFTLLLCAAALTLASKPAAAQEPSVVGLTTEIPDNATPADRKLAAALSDALKQCVAAEKRFTIVERPAAAPAAPATPAPPNPDERERAARNRPMPDVRVLLQILPSADAAQPARVRLSLGDVHKNINFGVTATSLDEAMLEDTALELSRFISIAAQQPQRRVPIVAVAPFENVGQANRLRPLENGIRDLIANRLLVRSGATLAGGLLVEDYANSAQRPAPRGTFQVLRVKDFEQLLGELAVNASALPEGFATPPEFPSPSTSYLIRGQFEQRDAKGGAILSVRGTMIQASTQQAVQEFHFQSAPENLDERLAYQIDRLVGTLPVQPAEAITTRYDVEALRNQVMGDLHRLECRRDGYEFDFCISREHAPPAPAPPRRSGLGAPGGPGGRYNLAALHNIQTTVTHGTPACGHLLRKSIDRLETILLITPDDPLAVLALGFCYSLPEEGTYRPARADELLRRACLLDKEAGEALRKASPAIRSRPVGPNDSGTGFRSAALEYLVQIGYSEATDAYDAAEYARTIKRFEFAFEHSTENKTDLRRWRQLHDFNNAYFQAEHRAGHELPESPETLAALVAFLPKLEALAMQVEGEQPDGSDAPTAVVGVAYRIARQTRDRPELRGVAIDMLTRWAAADKYPYAQLGLATLTRLCTCDDDFRSVAALFEKAAAKMAEMDLPARSRERDQQLTTAARCYRLGHDPQKGLELLASMDLFASRLTPVERHFGEHHVSFYGCELGACYEALGKREEARATYVWAIESEPDRCRSDILVRIKDLGGVPLRADRTVDVRYFPLPMEKLTMRAALATDGSRIFAADQTGVYAFEIAGQAWTTLSSGLGPVTCLRCDGKTLWAGTDAKGLWRCDPSTRNWTHIAGVDELGDAHVESLAIDEGKIYVGVGTAKAGRLATVDSQGHVERLAQDSAPPTVPLRIVVTQTGLLVKTQSAIHEWSNESKSWLSPTPWAQGKPYHAYGLFAGLHGTWGSTSFHELFRWGESEGDNAIFRKAWFPEGQNQGGYAVNFVVERGDSVWFGGAPRDYFTSSGLYRVKLTTGELETFGPRDEFRPSHSHFVCDGLWLDDRLWLLTAEGLCVVTERK